MTGSVAQTIQGEAGSNPANQFAVASTIYNRLHAGGYGSSANAIVNAPQQFVGFNASPNSTAQSFADAIENGTLPSMGNTGNAVNFQSGSTAARNGFTNGGANIGGNFFSDRFGAPTSNFVAPSYGGAGSTIAHGPTDTSSGVNAGSGSVAGNGAGSPDQTGQQQQAEGAPVKVGLQPEAVGAIQGWVNSFETSVGTAFADALKHALAAVGIDFGAMQNWFLRAALIALGIVIIVAALLGIFWEQGGEQVVRKYGPAFAA
jgi:Cell Wall Hydrolase